MKQFNYNLDEQMEKPHKDCIAFLHVSFIIYIALRDLK